MKHNKNHDNAPNAGPQLVPVRFEFTHPTATTVCVAGTFNHWQPESKTLHSSGVGHWWKETALAPGTYEYCLVVEQWMPDPWPETVPNPFGGRNSVLKVARRRSSPSRRRGEFTIEEHNQIERTEHYGQTNTSNR
jgi:1,4-alpha-glucan branching enzyme